MAHSCWAARLPAGRASTPSLVPLLVPANLRTLPAVETLLERWVVHYYPQLPEGAGGAPHLSRSQLARLSPSTVYK